jgi:hypothetical protein
MKWLFRPSVLAALSAALLVGAAVLALWPPAPQLKPAPLAVASGDVEIVWLYGATNPTSWERFVAAVQRAGRRLQDVYPGVTARVDGAFPRETTAVPEASLSWPGKGGRLVFRWYKLTSEWKTRDWVEALLKRPRPPLAIIGGNNSDAARELAGELARQGDAVPEAARPLLLLTTATADSVRRPGEADESRPAELMKLYPGRTFRFCFSNEQMGRAVMNFLWTDEELTPDATPIHLVEWDDDVYSDDLITGFWNALPDETKVGDPSIHRIASSVGGFHAPNRYEAEAVASVLAGLERVQPRQRKPALVVAGQTAPSRRFLRALAQTAPAQARRLVVVTGDPLAFNTVYRDRRVTWPIQELPFSLVFFCHYNPIDEDAGFHPHRAPHGSPEDKEGAAATTGTEDVLLDGDVVEALAQAFRRDGRPAADAGELRRRLAEVTLHGDRVGYDPAGKRLFDDDGNRAVEVEGGAEVGSGAHVVVVQPRVEGERVLPEAKITVWVWQERLHGEAGKSWQRRGAPLTVSYDPPAERTAP